MYDPTGIQTQDHQIMDSIFHVPEMLTLTTDPSGTFDYNYGYIKSILR